MPNTPPEVRAFLTLRQASDAALAGIVTSLAAVLGGAVLLMGLAALLGNGPTLPARVSVGLWTAVVASGVLIVRHKRGVTRRAGAVAILATLLLWLPVLVCGADIAASGGSVGTSSLGSDRDVFSPVVHGIIVFGVPFLLFVTVSVVRHPALDRVLTGTALLVLLGVGVATALAFARVGRPDPDTYVAHLPVVQTLRVGETLHLPDGTPVAYVRRVESQMSTLEGVDMSRVATGLSGEPLVVRYDSRSDFFTLASAGDPPVGFHGRTKKVESHLTAADAGAPIAPPIAWTLGGFLGLLVGGFHFLMARRHHQRKLSEHAIETHLEESGWAAMGKGERALVSAPPAKPGPVVLLLQAAMGNAYRDGPSGRVRSWRRGTLAELQEELASDAVALDALALTTALLCATPLVVWWLSWPQHLS
jgi:hypothetical protein